MNKSNEKSRASDHLQSKMRSMIETGSQVVIENQFVNQSQEHIQEQLKLAQARKQTPVNVQKSNQRRWNQLDSYLLLDYKAVGVDLVIPAIEHDKMRIKMHHSSLTAQMANRNYRQAVGGIKQYNSNNYTFSPRVNCQENGLTISFLKKPCTAKPKWNHAQGRYHVQVTELARGMTSHF